MNKIREKIYLFLLDESGDNLKKAQEFLRNKNFPELIDNEKKEVGMMILKGLFFLTPIIVERLLILLPKFLAKKLYTPKVNVSFPYHSFWLSIAKFLYSPKNFSNVFVPIVSDWQEEYFEALSKKEIWKARWINVRYTYAFTVAMWQKSPIGDFIEFVIKIAKQ